jgi:hypothetical protein
LFPFPSALCLFLLSSVIFPSLIVLFLLVLVPFLDFLGLVHLIIHVCVFVEFPVHHASFGVVVPES